MKACVLGMPALVQEGLIRLFAGEDAHKHVTFMVLSEMAADTALSIVNRSHRSPPELNRLRKPRLGCLDAIRAQHEGEFNRRIF
jgi:hypothetical protein